MTFTHEGNKTFSDGKLVNFEKMHMLAQTMRSIRNCRSRHLGESPDTFQSGLVLMPSFLASARSS